MIHKPSLSEKYNWRFENNNFATSGVKSTLILNADWLIAWEFVMVITLPLQTCDLRVFSRIMVYAFHSTMC